MSFRNLRSFYFPSIILSLLAFVFAAHCCQVAIPAPGTIPTFKIGRRAGDGTSPSYLLYQEIKTILRTVPKKVYLHLLTQKMPQGPYLLAKKAEMHEDLPATKAEKELFEDG